jgi:hypothetical protein
MKTVLWATWRKPVGLIPLHRLKFFVFLSVIFGTAACWFISDQQFARHHILHVLQFTVQYYILYNSRRLNIRRVINKTFYFFSFNEQYAWMFRAEKVRVKPSRLYLGKWNCKLNFPKMILKTSSWTAVCGKQRKITGLPCIHFTEHPANKNDR